AGAARALSGIGRRVAPFSPPQIRACKFPCTRLPAPRRLPRTPSRLVYSPPAPFAGPKAASNLRRPFDDLCLSQPSGASPTSAPFRVRHKPYLPGCPSPCGRQRSLLGRSCARPGVDPPRGAPTGHARPGRGYFVPHDREAVGVGSFSTPGLRCPPRGKAKPPRSLPGIAVEATSGDLT